DADAASGPSRYKVADETITAEGGSYSADMVGGSLHVVASSNVQIQIGDHVVNLKAGDDAWLMPVSGSIDVHVISGGAVVTTTRGAAATLATPWSDVSLATGVRPADELMSFPDDSASLPDDSGSADSGD